MPSYVHNRVPSKPGAQVRKPWCLQSSNRIGLGNPGGSDFRKRFITEIKFTRSKKKVEIYFFNFIFINSD
jgi:hypothetical protein